MLTPTTNKVAVALFVFATIVVASYHHYGNPLSVLVERLAEVLR